MDSYGERQVSGSLEGIREDHRQRYLWALARIPDRARVLDAGCGVGYGSHLLGEKAAQVLGVDIAEEAVAYANRFWKEDHIAFDVCDLHFLHFDEPAPAFDAVVAFECLEHLAIPELFLLRLRPYLAEDARLFVSAPNEVAQPFHLHRNPYHFTHYTRADLQRLMDRCGYDVMELCSQDDGEVRPDQAGRFLAAQCAVRGQAPELDLAALEAELPKRLQNHFSQMGQELAQALNVRRENEHLKEVLKERDALLKNQNQRLAKTDRERAIAQSKLEGTELVRREVEVLRQQFVETHKQHEKLAESVRGANLEMRQQREQLKQQQDRLRLQEKRVRDVWNHPAFRRLARFNWLGLKLLGLFGLFGQTTPAVGKQGGAPTPAPAQSGAAAPQTPPRAGKARVSETSLPEPHQAYVQGFCSLGNIYGAREKSRSQKRLVVDVTRVFSEHLTGVGHYCDQLARALIRTAPHDIVLYSGRPLPAWVLQWPGYPQFVHCPPNKVVRDPAKYDSAPPLETFAGEHAAYVDASAAYYPMVRAARRLTFIHDLAPVSCPETVPEHIVRQCEAYAHFQAAHAECLLANSEYTKKEFCAFTGLEPKRVHVVPVGLDDVFRQPVSDGDRERVRNRYGLDRPFLLCVGTLQPRKNVLRLIKAYGRLCESDADMPQLVLTGTDKWAEMPEFNSKLDELHQRHAIEWTGYVDRLDMPALYNLCELFVYPSYFEGYGMPVAEAMAAGAPVACADRTSLPEVADEAAVYFDPYDEDAIAEALRNTLADSALREELREKSRNRAESFLSWDGVAGRYLDLLQPWLGS